MHAQNPDRYWCKTPIAFKTLIARDTLTHSDIPCDTLTPHHSRVTKACCDIYRRLHANRIIRAATYATYATYPCGKLSMCASSSFQMREQGAT
jgi:hypothetical protein